MAVFLLVGFLGILHPVRISMDIIPVVPKEQLPPTMPSGPLKPLNHSRITQKESSDTRRTHETAGLEDTPRIPSPKTLSSRIANASRTNGTTAATATDHPVLLFRKGLSSRLPSQQIPVVLWPFMDPAAAKNGKGTSADVLHIEVNGVNESSILTLAQDGVRTLDPNVVWVTDAKFPLAQWCTRLAEKAAKIQKLRQAQSIPPFVWPIYVVDFTDPPQLPKRCPALENVVGPAHVLYFKRSIVAGRSWNFTNNWLHLGHPLPPTATMNLEQTPLIVRTDIVQSIAEYLAQQDGLDNHTSLPLRLDNLPNRPRSVDVAHHWPPSTEVAQFSNLRNRVSTWLIDKFGQTTYQVHCDMIGQHDRVGRRHAQKGYVEAMVTTKILVVAQRDTYEDHYRLWEALASGAMVVTDPMLTLPSTLQNGTHLLIYHSLEEMVAFVKHYLEHPDERLGVARAGYSVAMGRHRSWHRMEEIILGRVITSCEQLGLEDGMRTSSCPFAVHTNEYGVKAKH